MAIHQAIVEADIRDRIDKLVAAIRATDLEGVKSIYAPDIVSFDFEPPLQHVGADGNRKNWLAAFALYQPPVGYEIRNFIAHLHLLICPREDPIRCNLRS